MLQVDFHHPCLLTLEPRPVGQPLCQYCLATAAEGREHGEVGRDGESSVTSVRVSLANVVIGPLLISKE